MSDFNKCSDCYVAEQENKHLQAEIKRLRQLVEEAFFEGFGDGVTAGHPMGSRSSDSEAWENSNSKEEVSYKIDSGKLSREQTNEEE